MNGEASISPTLLRIAATALAAVSIAGLELVFFQMSGIATWRVGLIASLLAAAAPAWAARALWGSRRGRTLATTSIAVAGALFGVVVLARTPATNGLVGEALTHLPTTHAYLDAVLSRISLPQDLHRVGQSEPGSMICFSSCPRVSHLYLASGSVHVWEEVLSRQLRQEGVRLDGGWESSIDGRGTGTRHITGHMGQVKVVIVLTELALSSERGDEAGSSYEIPIPTGQVGVEITAGSPF